MNLFLNPIRVLLVTSFSQAFIAGLLLNHRSAASFRNIRIIRNLAASFHSFAQAIFKKCTNHTLASSSLRPWKSSGLKTLLATIEDGEGVLNRLRKVAKSSRFSEERSSFFLSCFSSVSDDESWLKV